MGRDKSGRCCCEFSRCYASLSGSSRCWWSTLPRRTRPCSMSALGRSASPSLFLHSLRGSPGIPSMKKLWSRFCAGPFLLLLRCLS